MNRYLATVRIRGQLVKTAIYADCSIHARLLILYQFGDHALASGPRLLEEGRGQEMAFASIAEMIKVIKPIKPRAPLTADQTRIQRLKQNIQVQRQQLRAERERQRRQRLGNKFVPVPPASTTSQ